DQNLDYEIKKLVTEGDKKSANGQNLFDKAHFVEDIEDSLISKDADVAVHSLKDMSSKDRDGLEIYAAIAHSVRNDVLIYRDGVNLSNLENLHIGTSSLRRKRQCKFFLGNENCSEVRGNIDTRLEKLHKGDYDAIILARAGIERLQFNENYIDLDFLPAIGQGVIAIQCRSNDEQTKAILSKIRDESLHQCIEIERYIVRRLNASCSSALSVEANLSNNRFNVDLEIYGSEAFISKSTSSEIINQKEALNKFIDEIISEGGLELLNENN
ncbi:MAG: hydroxymethylbilane synthase, partial [Gammaproteobacteria bacterium]